MDNFQGFLQKIRSWVVDNHDLRAVVVIGSQARQNSPADQFSDLDLVLFSTHAEVYARDEGWLEAIGTPWLAVRNTTGRGDPEWMVVFEGGAKVDFVFSRLAEELRTAPLRSILEYSPYSFAYARGVRVLYDRENPASESRIFPFPAQSEPNPTEDEFSQTVQRFFLQALRSARFLRRGELWRAVSLINGKLKDPYLTMLEWHARKNGSDTWYEGHFLEEWADPRAVHDLPGLFAAYDPAALWDALYASLAAFRWTAGETAGQLGLVYPADLDARITREIRNLRNPQA